MKYIIIDLEMNPLSKEFREERRICRNEIIQIGAVALDENYQEVGAFKTFVKPQFNEMITRKIENLTGITTAMVQEAPVFEKAIRQFLGWCKSLDDVIQIQQWSESDIVQIDRELCLKEVVLPGDDQLFLQDWKDFQYEFGRKLGLSDQISLKNAIMYAGVDNVGRYHDALFDARNTAKLFGIIRDPVECKKALSLVISALNPVSHNATLGELFNFSEFALIS